MKRHVLIALWFAVAAMALAADAQDPLQKVTRGGHTARPGVQSQIKIITWNIERGLRYDDVVKFLTSERADILLLQEVDVNAKRSGNRRIPEELARTLGMEFAFAPEFEELGQRASSTPAYQGQAVLSAAPITAAQMIRFSRQSDFWRPRWFVPNMAVFQRRNGGRLALAADLKFPSAAIVVYNVHLESRQSEDIRVHQMQEVLKHADMYHKDRLVILAGDLNVSGSGSPVIQAIESAGFRRAAGGEVTTLRGAPLDWIFVRGSARLGDPKVHRSVLAADHYPVSQTIVVDPGFSGRP